MNTSPNTNARPETGDRLGAIGTRRGPRRGSALILAVGVLALVSVFASVYLLIGQTDQRTAAVVAEARQTEEIEDLFARYIAGSADSGAGDDQDASLAVAGGISGGMIVADLFDAYPRAVGIGGSGPALRFFREATDRPWADFTMRSSTRLSGMNAGDVDELRFRPSGGHIRLGGSRFRVASDPWLASTEATWVGFEPRDPRFGRLYSRGDPELFWLDNRGWWKISNIAPDGRFVNLFNLRNNWGVRPGFGANSDDPDDLEDNGTSDRLSLLNPRPDGRLEATLDLPWNMGSVTEEEIRNTPAWFTMFQRGMAFPIGQGFGLLDPGGEVAGWESPFFPDYQYADADGDGLADSRWQELIDATLADQIRWLVPEGEYRWFVAARVIDLSSMVNIHTATDGLVAATTEAPPGATPSSVDLRRRLTMADAAEFFRPADLSPGPIDQPVIERLGPSRWELPNNFEIRSGGAPQGLPLAEDFREYRLALSLRTGTQSLPPDLDPSLTDRGQDRFFARGEGPGVFGYDAVKRAIRGSFVYPVGTLAGGPGLGIDGGLPYPEFDVASPRPIWDDGDFSPERFLVDRSPFEPDVQMFATRQAPDPDATAGETFDLARPLRFYTRFNDENIAREPALAQRDYWNFINDRSARTGLQPSSSDDEAAFGFVPFGVESMAELLTFFGINDDRVLSDLERVFEGRYRTVGSENPLPPLPGANFDFSNLSPLASRRPTDLDRLQHDDQPSTGTNFSTDPQPGYFPDGIVDAETYAAIATSVRRRVTLVSGARPIRERELGTQGGSLDLDDANLALRGDADLKTSLIDFDDVRESPSDPEAPSLAIVGARAWFNQHVAPGLAPGIFENDAADAAQAWRQTENTIFSGGSNTPPNRYQTAFYGHVGPEFALRTAAHLSLNLTDSADENVTPAALAVLFDNRARSTDDLSNDFNGNPPSSGSNPTLAGPWNDPWLVAKLGTQAADTGDDPLNGATNRIDLDADMEGNPSLGDGDLRGVSPSGTELNHREAAVVFGVEPHPILTEVAMWNVWADSGNEAGRNTEDDEYDPFGDDSLDESGVNIDVSLHRDNRDLMMHAMVFQIHNPYEVPVTLGVEFESDDDPATFDPAMFIEYYVEHNGRFFALADVDLINNRFTGPVRLGPGETRNFVVLHDDPADIATAWNRAIGQNPAGVTNATADDVIDLINTQLSIPGATGGATAPLIAVEFNPGATGGYDPSAMFDGGGDTDFFTPGSEISGRTWAGRQARFESNREFRLWRGVRYGIEAEDDDNGPQDIDDGVDPPVTRDDGVGEPWNSESVPVWWQNDVLVDRLRDPVAVEAAGLAASSDVSGRDSNWPSASATTLARSRAPFGRDFAFGEESGSNIFIDGAFVYEDARPIPNDASLLEPQEWGLTIARWAAVRRGDHGRPLRDGEIPAWMIESYDGETNQSVPIGEIIDPRRSAIAFGGGPPVMEFIDVNSTDDSFDAASAYANLSFWDWYQHMRDAANGGEAVPSIVNEPAAKAAGLADAPGDPSDVLVGSVWTERTLDDLNGIDLADKPVPWLFDNNNFANVASGDAGGIGGAFGSTPPAGIGGGRLRLLDVLTALPVGPAYTPSNAPSSGEVREWHWMTTGEALAAALGFQNERFYYETGNGSGLIESIVHTEQGDDYTTADHSGSPTYPYTPYAHLWFRVDAGSGRWHSRLDQGRLAYDDYPAFYNLAINPDETLALPMFDPEDGDFSIGGGIPTGLRIVEDLIALPYRDVPGEQADVDQGRMTSPHFGTVNINTASPMVMRSLPGLSPLMGVDMAGNRLWWPQRLLDLGVVRSTPENVQNAFGLPDPYRGPITNIWDMAYANVRDAATGLLAYRDLALFQPRPLAVENPRRAFSIGNANSLAYYEDLDAVPQFQIGPLNVLNDERQYAIDYRPASVLGAEFRDAIEQNFQTDLGRAKVTGVWGGRGEYGFGSRVEVAAATLMTDRRAGIWGDAAATPIEPDEWTTEPGVQAAHPFIMDTLGRDYRNILQVGNVSDARQLNRKLALSAPVPDGSDIDDWGFSEIGSVTVADFTDTDANEDVRLDAVPNDLAERLALANGIMNTIDVRSDFFAAWFVIRGYRESDVTGLGEEDPMLPSYERRYLMVIDRSNVTRPSDEPRVLIFREVPL